jgi:hypothetical protein
MALTAKPRAKISSVFDLKFNNNVLGEASIIIKLVLVALKSTQIVETPKKC